MELILILNEMFYLSSLVTRKRLWRAGWGRPRSRGRGRPRPRGAASSPRPPSTGYRGLSTPITWSLSIPWKKSHRKMYFIFTWRYFLKFSKFMLLFLMRRFRNLQLSMFPLSIAMHVWAWNITTASDNTYSEVMINSYYKP